MFRPLTFTADRRLTVVIPYRDREQHLRAADAGAARTSCSEQGCGDRILVVEQEAGQPFNRGRLLNVGMHLRADATDYYCLHDVDAVPIVANYACPSQPLRLVNQIVGTEGEAPAQRLLLLRRRVDPQGPGVQAANGFSNEYWGWGKEDDDFFLPPAARPTACATSTCEGTYQDLPNPPHQQVQRDIRWRRRTSGAIASAAACCCAAWRIPPTMGSARCAMKSSSARLRPSTARLTKKSACAGERLARSNRQHVKDRRFEAQFVGRVGGRLACWRPSAAARGVSPYLPLNLSPEIERQIERVLILADRADHVAPDRRRDRARCAAGGVPHRPSAVRAGARAIWIATCARSASTTPASRCAADDGAGDARCRTATACRTTAPGRRPRSAYWQPSDYIILSLGGVAYDGRCSRRPARWSASASTIAQLDIGYRALVFAVHRQRDADQHRGADAALGHALELHAAHALRAAL